MENIRVFKSMAGREKIRDYYNNILGYFPFHQLHVDTSYGKTFVLEAGDPMKQPVILLHGSCSNSAAWLGDIPILAEGYHVFSVDIPGEPGNSAENRLDFHSGEYPSWLGEVLDGLGIDRASIVGNSMGGWLALHFAANYPDRIQALALLAPSGIVLPKQSFIDQTADMAESASESLLSDVELPREVLEFMALVMDNFNPFTGALPVLSDDDMMKLDIPVLYIAGKGDITMDAELAAKRLLKLVPLATVHLTDDSHIILGVSEKIKKFLDTVNR